jgi:hypothetical protein
MRKLTILRERALVVLQVMFAELCFVLLLKGIELSLISIKVVIVWLLRLVSRDFFGWFVEVSWSSMWIVALVCIARLLTDWMVLLILVYTKNRSVIMLILKVISSFFQINLTELFWALRIRLPLFLLLLLLGLVICTWLALSFSIFLALLCFVTGHFLWFVWFWLLIHDHFQFIKYNIFIIHKCQ